MPRKPQPAYVLGVGMTKFIKPRGKVDYTELGFEAGIKAMLDAQISYDDVDQGVACYCYGDSTCGQRVFYQFGMTQIPIYSESLSEPAPVQQDFCAAIAKLDKSPGFKL